jgi:hypothetical protein
MLKRAAQRFGASVMGIFVLLCIHACPGVVSQLGNFQSVAMELTDTTGAEDPF